MFLGNDGVLTNDCVQANSVQGRCGEIEEEAKQSAGADDGVVIDAETGGAMITGNENAGPYHLRGQ